MRKPNLPKVLLRIAQPRNARHAWGDFYFGYALKKSLQKLDCDVRVLMRDDPAPVVDHEIVLLGLGLSEYHPSPQKRSVAWVISHPECNGPELVGRYSHVFVCSKQLANAWGVDYLPQAFDADVHYAPTSCGRGDGEEAPLPYNVVFVGLGRPVERVRLIATLMHSLPGVLVWGHGFPPDFRVKGLGLPWMRTADVYRNARIVVGHTSQEMRESGMINDRVFQAVACGAFVISDAVKGLGEVFPEMVTYTDPKEAVHICRYFLEHEAERRLIAAQCRQRVQCHHFDDRAVRIAKTLGWE